MKKGNWTYKKPKLSTEPAPFIPIIVKNPLKEYQVKIDAFLDTGYDGVLLIPEDIFLKISLDEIETPPELSPNAETYGGEQILLRSSIAEIIIPNLEISFFDEIDCFKDPEVLIGRKFINAYLTTLNGPKKILELMIENLEL